MDIVLVKHDLQEKGGGQGSFVSFSEETEMKDPAASSPLLRFVAAAAPPVPLILLLLPLLLSLLPHPPPSSICVYCCVFPHGLIVVFVSFRPSPRAPSALRPLFRCVVPGTARSLASSSKRLSVMCDLVAAGPQSGFQL